MSDSSAAAVQNTVVQKYGSRNTAKAGNAVATWKVEPPRTLIQRPPSGGLRRQRRSRSKAPTLATFHSMQ